MSGNFVWFDLSVDDIPASIRFYTELLGWTTEAWGGGDMPYTMFQHAGEAFGGVMPLADAAKAMGAPPNWLGYIAVDDVDAAVARSEALGGTTYVPGTDIPNTGRFAVLADPAGGTVAVFTSSNPGGAPPRAVAWCELASTDVAKAWPWYAAMFGWQVAESMAMPDGNTYQMIKTDGEAFAGISPAQMPVSAWAYYFAVADARATFETALGRGCTPLYPPMQVPGGGWAALLTDPHGVAFGLFSMA